jgi:hypothetical protein
MNFHPSQRAGFLSGSPSQCAGRRRRAALAQLLTSGALLTCLVVAVSAVLIDIAGAAPAPGVHGGTGVAVAAFAAVVAAALVGRAAIAFGRRRAHHS